MVHPGRPTRRSTAEMVLGAIHSLKDPKGSTTKDIQKYLNNESMDTYISTIKFGLLHLQMKNLIQTTGSPNRWTCKGLAASKVCALGAVRFRINEAACVCPGDKKGDKNMKKKKKKDEKKVSEGGDDRDKKDAKGGNKKGAKNGAKDCGGKSGSRDKDGRKSKNGSSHKVVVEFCAKAKCKTTTTVSSQCGAGKEFVSFKASHSRAAPFKSAKTGSGDKVDKSSKVKNVKGKDGGGDCAGNKVTGSKAKGVAENVSKGKSNGQKSKSKEKSRPAGGKVLVEFCAKARKSDKSDKTDKRQGCCRAGQEVVSFKAGHTRAAPFKCGKAIGEKEGKKGKAVSRGKGTNNGSKGKKAKSNTCKPKPKPKPKC